jgi:hypothetical protein
MVFDATWLVGTIVIILLQIAYVRWQMRWARSLDRFTEQERSTQPSLDVCDAEACD